MSRPALSYQHTPSSVQFIHEHTSQRLRLITEKYPDNLAIACYHQQKEATYAEFNHDVDEIAKGLVALGLQKGDRIGIYAPNRYEWVLV